MLHKSMLFCCYLFFLISCQSASISSVKPTLFTQNIMTIDYRILVGDRLNETNKHQIQQIIQATFQEIDAIYNKWNPSSELSQLNALPAHTPYPLSPSLYQFLQRLESFVYLSEGRFDPTIESIQQLWKEKLTQGQCPSEQEIALLKPSVGWHTLHFKDGIFSKEDSRTQLDLGGVAKGLSVDLLIERLSQAGYRQLFVEWGGEIRATGMHPAGRPWHVYISRLGNPDPSQALAYLQLIDRALATSGDYFQSWNAYTQQGEQKTFCHIFNPHTLTPVEVKAGSVASASLLARDCVTADALAKVLMLFDSVEEAQIWIKKLQEPFPELACWIAKR